VDGAANEVGRASFDSKALRRGQDMRFRGDIAEIVAYDTSLADAQRMQVESYLRGHWGL
jgi:hypothetical protein